MNAGTTTVMIMIITTRLREKTPTMMSTPTIKI